MNNENEVILEKVKKLLALGQSPNESEAAAAIAKAHKLLLEYNLSMEDITEEKSLMEEVYEEGGKIRNWKQALLNQIFKSNFCGMYKHTIRSQGNLRAKSTTKIMIVGKAHNVAMAKAMADYLLGAIDRMAKDHYGIGKEAMEAYKTGLADTLIVKLMEMIKEDEAPDSGVRDLVVNNRAEIDNFFKDMKKSNIKRNINDENAYAQGRQDGQSISLNRQMRGECSQALQLS